MFKRLVPLALAASLAGCAHAPKMNAAKVHAAKRVAIVGVCSAPEFGGTAGLSTTIGARWAEAVLPSEAQALQSALPGAWHSVEIVPLTDVVARQSLPRGAGGDRRVCFGGFDPLAKNRKPDAPLMAQLANALQVDAVLALWQWPSIHSGASKAQVYVDYGSAYLVDRSGETIATLAIKGVESDKIEKLVSTGFLGSKVRRVSDQEFQLIGTSLGQSLASRLGEGLSR